MKNYLAFALSFTSGFLQIHFEKVSRSQSTRADILSKPGLCETNEGNMDGVLERKKYRQKNMYNHRSIRLEHIYKEFHFKSTTL